ncbi:glycosyltransferase family 2 protein [Sphingobacterium daejeonense]|jgi:glycosyltransferase involved in cell wall biosynthesis|uniref:Glycosyltransferase family 2 protein n=1 Tax=Sphingobacterium daejeonense TaxID=371142 RepID=A0ABW3RJ54_9SPHI|nr:MULTISPECIES: glycosyltransferase family 2 protein [Sphingobacterium]MCT1529375.1 glycosyltransferase family 2 protein [Sphingobacterium daejeonense]
MIANSITLILSTYNWPSALQVCLVSIKQQTILPTEVIIADDGSTYETKQLIDNFKKDFPVPIIHLWQEDIGFRKSRILNQAFARSNYDYIIQIDGDVFLNHHFIKDHIHASRPNYLLQGSRVMLGKEYSQKVLHEQKPHFNLFGKGNKRIENSVRLPLLSDYLLNRYKNKYPIYYARGANMSFWKKDIFDINGYNESYEGWGHEDSDLTLRMMNNGVKKSVIKFAAIVYHLYHAENIRPDLELKNKLIMEQTLKDQVIWTEKGLNQYLKD